MEEIATWRVDVENLTTGETSIYDRGLAEEDARWMAEDLADANKAHDSYIYLFTARKE